VYVHIDRNANLYMRAANHPSTQEIDPGCVKTHPGAASTVIMMRGAELCGRSMRALAHQLSCAHGLVSLVRVTVIMHSHRRHILSHFIAKAPSVRFHFQLRIRQQVGPHLCGPARVPVSKVKAQGSALGKIAAREAAKSRTAMAMLFAIVQASLRVCLQGIIWRFPSIATKAATIACVSQGSFRQ
jgi:hypothetical protein